MKLLRFEIKRFGRFEDMVVDFADGLNVVFGNNESGKTTLAQALLAVLFDNPTQLPDEIARYSNRHFSHPFLLHLEYQSGGRTYHLTKDVATGIALLEQVETGSKWNTLREIQEETARALGSVDRDFYLATSFIRQGELSRVCSAGSLISDKFEKLLNNNKDELLTSRILKRLSDRLAQISGQEPERPGEIAILERRVEGWQTELEAYRLKGVEDLEARKRFETIDNELQITRKLFGEKLDLFKKSKLACEAEQQLNNERDVFLELGRRTMDAQEVKRLITIKKETLKSLQRIDRSDLKSTESLAALNQVNQGRIEDAAARVEQDKAAVEQARPRNWHRVLVSVCLPAALIFGILWYRSHDLGFLLGGIAAVAVASAMLKFWASAVTLYRHAETKLQEAESRLREEEEHHRRGNETLLALLHRYDVKDADEMAERFEGYRDLERDIKGLVARYETLLCDSNLKDLETELDKLTSLINQQQETFSKYRAYAISPQKLEQMQKEVGELDKTLTQLEDEATILAHKLQYLESGTDIIAPLQERIDEGQKEIAELQEEGERIQLIYCNLDEARRRVLKSSVEVLEDEASSFLQVLTGGSWRRLRLDRQTFACDVTADGEHWLSSATELSKGVQDALYLALRLALSKVIPGETRPPLVLEDPLVSLDQQRRNEAVGLLKELAQTQQVVFLTADPEYAEVADHLIDLHSVCSQPVALALASVP